MSNCFESQLACNAPIAFLPVINAPVPLPRLLANEPYMGGLTGAKTVTRQLGYYAGHAEGTIVVNNPKPSDQLSLRFKLKSCRQPWFYDLNLNLAVLFNSESPCETDITPASPDCMAERLAKVMMADPYLNSLISFTITPTSALSEEGESLGTAALTINWTMSDPALGVLVVTQNLQPLSAGTSAGRSIPDIVVSNSNEKGGYAHFIHGQPVFYNPTVDPSMRYVFPWAKAQCAQLQFAGFYRDCLRCAGCSTANFPYGIADTSYGYGYEDSGYTDLDCTGCGCGGGCGGNTGGGNTGGDASILYAGSYVAPIYGNVPVSGQHNLAITADGKLTLVPAEGRVAGGIYNLGVNVRVMAAENEKVAFTFS